MVEGYQQHPSQYSRTILKDIICIFLKEFVNLEVKQLLIGLNP